MISSAPYYAGPYLITPHPLAPHFLSLSSASLYLPQVVTALQSESSQNAEAISLIRELALSSLFFFINGILKASGPYEALDDSLSLSMCNFRQSEACERDGAHAAVFMPRGFSKSRVFTHGGTTWDLLRNPNERAVVANAIYDKAQEFLHQIQRNFDSNPLMSQFFPEYVPSSKSGQVTADLLILPNRRGSAVEPSCKCLGLTGAAEGGHYTLITLDDLVGLDSLDQHRQSTAQMGTARKWFNTNKNALRMTEDSRLIIAATRYAVDDCYADVYKSCKTVTGWTQGDLQPDPHGEWDVYYRLVEEDGLYLRPDVMNEENLTRLLEEDPWAAMTQYYNSPSKAGLAEFTDYEVGKCELLVDEDTERFWIRRLDPNRLDDSEEYEVSLDSCDCLCVTDLAATDTNMNAKTCRTAIEVWAKDSRDFAYLLWSRVGFFSIFQSFDYIFEANRVFRGYARGTIIEANAFQKIIRPILLREQEQRIAYINPIAVNAKGDKKARIRSAFGMYLPRKKIYSTKEALKPLLEELKLFPMNDSKLDALDAGEKALVYLVRNETREEREVRQTEEENDRFSSGLNCVGY